MYIYIYIYIYKPLKRREFFFFLTNYVSLILRKFFFNNVKQAFTL